MSTKTYLVLHLNRWRGFLRRYSNASAGACAVQGRSYHDAKSAPIGEFDESGREAFDRQQPDKTDQRWPAACACGYAFSDADHWQHFAERLGQRVDTGEVASMRDFPPGMIYDADWLHDNPQYVGPDGKALHCRLPNGNDWHIDGRASNCDSPCSHCGQPYHAHAQFSGCCSAADQALPWLAENRRHYHDARPHKCWVRHGEAPELHVDKNGVTCGAGAGSIASGSYHGFLHGGHLT